MIQIKEKNNEELQITCDCLIRERNACGWNFEDVTERYDDDSPKSGGTMTPLPRFAPRSRSESS